jgi:hypothetical protein
VTAKKFKNYQGFDLANFDEACIFKIRKSETFWVFKENISQSFNILPEKVRFWVFMNRRNEAIRPYAPIPESYLDISK